MFNLIATAHAAETLSVKLSPYVLGHVGGLPITATLLTSWLAMLMLIAFAIWQRNRLAAIPGRVQNVTEAVVGGIYDYVASTLEDEKLAQKYFPILMTIFVFLLVMNWVGLLPGVTSIGFYQGQGAEASFVPFLYPPATDLNIAIAFAFIAVLLIQFVGIVALGAAKYGSKFINFSSPLAFVIGIIELISELGRLISFSFRLFGNIFAGKTLLTVAIFFVPFILPVPILAYEVFVGFIQAGVFMFLTLVFMKLAVAEHH